MRYAEISVNSPVAQRRTFSYAIPPRLNISAGHAVWVPFGDHIRQGVVMAITDHPAVEEVREIAGAISPDPLVSPARLSLARWISQHYLCPLFDAVAVMLPPGFRRSMVTSVSPTGAAATGRLTVRQRRVLELVAGRDKVSLQELEQVLGMRNPQAVVAQLVGRGLAVRSHGLRPPRVRPRMLPFLQLAVDASTALKEADRLVAKVATRQASLLRLLAEEREPVPLPEARRRTGAGRGPAEALAKRGLVTIREIEVRRQPFAHQGITPSSPLPLKPAQQAAFDAIRAALARAPADGGSAEVFLLHGVTGSGKTEVYLQALAEAVRLGRRGIVLVPEIALTPQTVERFAARFPNRVAVLHSQLSMGEKYDEWQAISQGQFDVVIGPRSAVFAPQPDLGLIVIDEEHEWTYKQQEQSPHYHAREVVIGLAELTGAVVVLGSATPDVETYHHARSGRYHYLHLPERVAPGASASLPEVTVVDLREELKAGNRSIFSRALSEAIESVLVNREQAILFLNRRGTASSVQCRTCGYVVVCPNCDIPLSYHGTEGFLLCHQCNHRAPVPQKCPQCGSLRIKYIGIGTQKLEHETRRAFPGARLLRWDSDVTRRKHAHQEILDSFRNQQADILIGTQMVAKGLDLPRVTLVGVIIADTGLSLPDFRAGEKTFQLLCQVSGRAGRGALGGRVIVQTYSPEHYAIEAAAGHDYPLFYSREIEYRRQLHEPPFSRLARLTYTDADDARCQHHAEKMRRRISEEMSARGIADLTLIGPAPAFYHRLWGQYRWQLILRGPDPSGFLADLPIPQGWMVDIDPVGL